MGGKNSVIPKGVKENLKIYIYNEKAAFKFDDPETTRKFAEGQIKDGVSAIYDDGYKLALCIYPKMTQMQIKTHIVQRFKALGAIKK